MQSEVVGRIYTNVRCTDQATSIAGVLMVLVLNMIAGGARGVRIAVRKLCHGYDTSVAQST